MSSLDILEFYWEMPYVVGISLKDLKKYQNNQYKVATKVNTEKLVEKMNKSLSSIKYDFKTNNWFHAVKSELPAYCEELANQGYDLLNSATCNAAAQHFTNYGLYKDGTSLDFTSTNMAGEGGRGEDCSDPLRIFQRQAGGFWGAKSGNENTPHHIRAFAPRAPKISPPKIRKNADRKSSEYSQQVIINYFDQNPIDFRREFLRYYAPFLSYARKFQRLIMNNKSTWKNKSDFTISEILSYAKKNPCSSTVKSLLSLDIKNFELQVDHSIVKDYYEYMHMKDDYDQALKAYKISYEYWKKHVPLFWKEHLMKLNMWRND